MPIVKTPEERGEFGWWAYEARDLLGLSPEQVVASLGKYNAATIRKAEADGDDMSGPLWRALVPYYQGVAEKRGITLRQPPRWGDAPAAAAGTDIAALTRAINDLVQELREERAAVLSALQEQGRVVGLLAALQGLGVDQIAKLLPPGGPPNGPGQSATRGTK